MPVAPNTNPDGSDNPLGRQRNRRVEIVVDTCKTFASEAEANAGNSVANATPSFQSSGSMTISDDKEATAATTAAATPDIAPTLAKNDELMPFNNLVTDEQIKEGFVNLKVTALDDPRFYFEVLTPKDWESHPLTVSKEQLANDNQAQVPLAELAPPNSTDVLTKIKYMRAQPSVSPEDFLLSYAKMIGADIVLRQHAEYNARKAEDALLKSTSTDTKKDTYTRITVSKRGDYMFVISSSVPQSDYDKWKRIFGIAAVSFNPCGK